MKATQYRQGDVFAMLVRALPPEAILVGRQNDLIVLAYGEATGHKHAIATIDADLFEAHGERYLRIGNSEIPEMHMPFVTVKTPTGFECHFEDGSIIKTDDPKRTRGALLVHEEHTTQAWPPGILKIAKPQREYTPTAIRNIAD